MELIRALHRHRHFGRAAAALGVSQPALTRSLKGLEDTLGVPLFEREGVTATIYGEIVLRHSQHVLAQFGDLIREISLAKGLEIGELQVVMGPYPADISGHRSAGTLLERHPGLLIEISVRDWTKAVGDVLDGTADIAIADISEASLEPGLITEPIRSSRLQFFCISRHPLAGKAGLEIADLLDFPWVGPLLPGPLRNMLPQSDKSFGKFEPARDRFRPRMLVETFHAAKTIVLESQAISACVPHQIAHELERGELIFLPIDAPWLRLNYGFIHKRGRPLSPSALAFMDIVRLLEKGIDADMFLQQTDFGKDHRALNPVDIENKGGN